MKTLIGIICIITFVGWIVYLSITAPPIEEDPNKTKKS